MVDRIYVQGTTKPYYKLKYISCRPDGFRFFLKVFLHYNSPPPLPCGDQYGRGTTRHCYMRLAWFSFIISLQPCVAMETKVQYNQPKYLLSLFLYLMMLYMKFKQNWQTEFRDQPS